MWRGWRQGLPAMVVAIALACAPAAAAEPVARCNVPIEMSDGIVLRANLVLPEAQGRFPVALTATGYNKDVSNPTGTNCRSGGGIVTVDEALVQAGYAVMILDDRGTGASQGVWDSWGQRTQDDYGEVLDWIQAQAWSDGKVATTGASYMGITSLLIAAEDAERVAAGKERAVRAVWADIPMADAYRDVTFHGGALDSGFMPFWLGLVNTLSAMPPSTTPSDPAGGAQTWLDHLTGNAEFAGGNLAGALLGDEEAAYDGPFYRTRSPVERAGSLRIPVAWTGGWWDLFQRGEPLLYEQLTNSPQRKFWMTPRYHASDDSAEWAEQGIGTVGEVRLRWFDRWLRGRRNGVESLAPVNLYTMGANRWQHLPSWPAPNTRYTPYHLNEGGTLTPAKPLAPGADEAPVMPASSPCSRLTTQWTAGLAALGPCETDNRTFEATSLTYTTTPVARDTEVTGLLSARLWAELTKPDATLIAVLSDVAPSGESTQVTAGFLMASQRAVDKSRSTLGPGGQIIRPWHPFTKASQKPVTPGQPQEYQVEIYPTSHVFKKGHSLRLTVATANTPTTAKPLPSQIAELGGEIRLLRGPAYPSSVLLPLR